MKAYVRGTYTDDPDVFRHVFYIIDNISENPDPRLTTKTIRGDIMYVIGYLNSGLLVMKGPHRYKKQKQQLVTGIIKDSDPREIGQGVKSSIINLIFGADGIKEIDL